MTFKKFALSSIRNLPQRMMKKISTWWKKFNKAWQHQHHIYLGILCTTYLKIASVQVMTSILLVLTPRTQNQQNMGSRFQVLQVLLLVKKDSKTFFSHQNFSVENSYLKVIFSRNKQKKIMKIEAEEKHFFSSKGTKCGNVKKYLLKVSFKSILL